MTERAEKILLNKVLIVAKCIVNKATAMAINRSLASINSSKVYCKSQYASYIKFKS